jgi:CO dehydrogenase nickel-insertion accessory protein CooC1
MKALTVKMETVTLIGLGTQNRIGKGCESCWAQQISKEIEIKLDA